MQWLDQTPPVTVSRLDRLYRQSDAARETRLLAEVSREELWSAVERLGGLVRESGSDGERSAAGWIEERLRSFGLAVTVHRPEILISSPVEASLEIAGEPGSAIPCKTPAFSRSTGPDGIEAEAIYLAHPREAPPGWTPPPEAALRGRIVVSEKLFMPPKVLELDRAEPAAQVFVKPGERLHEQGASAVWGNPTPESARLKPHTPVVCIRRSDGARLIERVKRGGVRLRIRTKLDERWAACPLVTADLPGRDPERFLLVHAHLDSWHWGVGDNATGDAVVLELARVLSRHRDALQFGVRFAWWPGHFNGHYAGSAWYADERALELYDRCFAHVDVDSPGCRWATEFTDLKCMMEGAALWQRVIPDLTGQQPRCARPPRAGDFSFNQIGVSGLIKSLSTIPAAVKKEKGFTYPVGGCGGNPVWHTEEDRLETADPEILLRDARIFAAGVFRTAASPVHPIDHTAAALEIREALERYQTALGAELDLTPALDAARLLERALHGWYRGLDEQLASGRVEAGAANAVLQGLSRRLVPVAYSRGERFDHDLGVPMRAVPRLERAALLAGLTGDVDRHHALRTRLLRERNEVTFALREACRTAGSR